MPAPIIPDEDARQTCLGDLRFVHDKIKYGRVSHTQRQAFNIIALVALKRMAGAMNMKDIAAEIERIVSMEGGEA